MYVSRSSDIACTICSGISNNPFHAHQNGDSTLKTYALEVVKLVAFLLRDKGEYRLPLPEDIMDTLAKIHALPPSASIGSYATLVTELLTQIWTRVWDRSTENSIGDLTLCYLALSSVRNDGSWAPPHLITPTIAKIIYALCCMVIVQLHSAEDIRKAHGEVERWHREKVESTFNSLSSLQHITSAIAYNTMSLPEILWTDEVNHTALLYQGDQISLQGMQVMALELHRRTYKVWMEEVLMHQPLRKLYSALADDLVDASPGYSFLNDRRNPPLLSRRLLMQNVLQDPVI